MNKQKSFTLIELLVVIVIIGILAGVIMISTSSSIDKANISKIRAFAENVKNSMLLNLISEWNFDEIAGDLNLALTDNTNVSDTWGVNDGKTYYGPILKGENDCVVGKCLEFNGNKTYVSIGSHPSLNIREDITIEYWVRQHSGGNINNWSQSTVSRRDCYDVCGNHFYTKSFPNYVINGQTITNKWIHVVYVYDYLKTTGFFYMDGKPKNTKDLQVAYPGLTDYRLGSVCGELSLSHQGYTFNGRLDEVRLYNAALPSSQIKQNYIAGLNSMLVNGNISKEDYNERINALAYEQE